MAGTPYVLQVNKKTTVSGDFNAGATSLTLASAAFSNFTSGFLVVDYDNDSKYEVIKCTVTGTAVTSITRAQNGTSDVDHSSGAKIGFQFVPGHYEGLKPQVATETDTGAQTANSTTYVTAGISKAFTTTGGMVIAIVSFSARTGTAGDFFQFRVKRDSTVLKTSGLLGGGGTVNERFHGTIFVTETPAAGAYTYDIEFNRASGGGTITAEVADLMLIEVPV